MKLRQHISTNGFRAVVVVLVAAAAATGCSRSVNQNQLIAAPVVLPPTGADLAGTSSDLGPLQPIALVPEAGAVTVAGADGHAGDDQVAARSKPMTPEEKARVIAELEALARQQANF
jgi:hypothetical protein